MRKRWLVDLTDEERVELEALTRRGKAPARRGRSRTHECCFWHHRGG